MTLERYLNDLSEEGKPLRHSSLLQLTGLSLEEVAEFELAWESVSNGRKRDALTRMFELGEDNLELDFTAVFVSCLGDDDELVREQATRGLWDCDDRTIIRPLISLLKDDQYANVRAAAATTLGKFAEMAQNGKLLKRDASKIQEALLSATDDAELDVRRRAIEAVGSFNTPEIEQIILEAYHSGDLKLKQSAIFAMGRSSDSEWLSIILEEMRDEEPAIRYEAAGACGQLGDATTVPDLIHLIADDDLQVQISVVQALGAVGGLLAKQALLRCVRMGDDDVIEAARVALDNIEFDKDPLGFHV